MPLVLGVDFWWWVERASWLVTILTVVGLAIGIVQLRLVLSEQRRIAKQLSARPLIMMGFMLPESTPRPEAIVSHHNVAVLWAEGQLFSEPVVLGFGVANEGERTALNLYHEITFVGNVIDVQCRAEDGTYFRDQAGVHHVVWRGEDLHPSAGLTHYVQLRVHRLVNHLSVRCLASYQDAPWIENQIDLIPSFRAAF